MVVQAQIDTQHLEGFATAIAAQDFDTLADCFHPEVRFRALTPNHTFGLFGSASAIATLKDWFGDEQISGVLLSEIEPVGDRIRLAYRFRAFKDDKWTVVEQQTFCTIEDGLIRDISIICSGFRPED